MDLKDIADMINLVGSSNLTEFELESRDCSVKMKKESKTKDFENKVQGGMPSLEELKNCKKNIQRKLNSMDKKNDDDLYYIKSPIEGTFYDLASSEKKPLVNVGSKIKKGDVLCIIEAMKLMNEIKSEVNGEVAEVFIKNGEVIEAGKPIFSVKILSEKKD